MEQLFDQNNQLMLEETNPAKSLERIQDGIHELLSNQWKDEAKAEFLLKLLVDSVNLQNNIKMEQRSKEPTEKELLTQTINQAETQKSAFVQITASMNEAHQKCSNFTQRFIKIILNIFSSAYAIKQLEYLINTNQRNEETIKLLTSISNQLKKQYQVESAAIEREHESEKTSARILQTIQEQMTREVKLKENQKQNLKSEIEKGLVLEMDKKKQYKDSLKTENQMKIYQILNGEEQSLQFMDSEDEKQRERAKPFEDIPTQKLKFETIKLPPTYYYEKIAVTVLSFLTILLLVALIVRP